MAIRMSASAVYRDPADAARAEAMVRALVPEGCEINDIAQRDTSAVPGDPMAQAGYFAVTWDWPSD